MTPAEAIRALVAQGKSYAEIGRAVGRDRSYISQVARGKRSGELLGPALERLERGETRAAPPLHRAGGFEVRAADAPSERGRIEQYRGRAGGAFLAIERAAGRGETFSLKLIQTARLGQKEQAATLYGKGYRASSLMSALEKQGVGSGEFEGFLYELLQELRETLYFGQMTSFDIVQVNFWPSAAG